MAKCPWCKITVHEAWIGKDRYASCMSTLNPGNKKKGDCTNTGVTYARCAEGRVLDGMSYKECPFFKKKTTRKRKK